MKRTEVVGRRSEGVWGVWARWAVALVLISLGTVAHGAAPAGQYTIATDTVRDNRTGRVWQRAVPGGTYTWANATTYCAGLNLGGFSSGWRLPTYKELTSIVDRRAYVPAIDTAAFPSTPSEFFWSSSPYAGDASSAWGVYFSSGGADGSGVGYYGRVRCVR